MLQGLTLAASLMTASSAPAADPAGGQAETGANTSPARPDLLLADFEGTDYGAWQVAGEAFGKAPAQGTLPNQMPVSGFAGKGLVNSYLGGDATTGTLTSPPFKLERKFLNFLIGGGKDTEKTAVRLLVDGKPVRTATGPNDRPGGSEALAADSWDTGEFTGKTAVFQVIDQATGGWGHISVDHIVQSDVRAEKPKIVTDVLYQETYRPQFHFTAKKNWLNDPNGMVFYNGEYHLFFQHNPEGINWGNMTWGHAVSKDLVHWTQLDHAIYPDKLGTVFSGSAVVDWENTGGFARGDAKALACLYTAAGGTSAASKGQPYTQCLATSTDGRTFTKHDQNPVLGHVAGENRDPKVIWYAPAKKWIMALFLNGDIFALFESKDLKSWAKLQEFRFPGRGECPDFFPLAVDGDKNREKWVFTAANGDYLLGSFDGKEFKPEGEPVKADYGRNYYAVQTFSDIPAADGRRIQIAWMNGGKYPKMPFNQQMSFPCEMTLHSFPEGPRICRRPVNEINKLHDRSFSWQDTVVTTGENLLKELSGGLYDIQMQVDLAGAREFGIKCRGETVTVSAEKKTLACLGSVAPLELADNQLDLRILVDHTSLEIFANNGKVVMTSCFLPAPGNEGLELFAEGGQARLRSLTVHTLRSAWPAADPPPHQATRQGDWFLLTSHKDQTDGLHLAVSRDGLRWEAVNQDKSVLKPAIPEVFRDPSLAQGDDGTWHLVWTIAWNSAKHKGIGHASSKDLIHWSEQTVIPVMENEPATEFIWAPELFLDRVNRQWIIHWSSSVAGKFPETLALFDGRANPRVYSTTTKDFVTFTPSRLLFNADCLAIDSYLYQAADRDYRLFFKADRREEPKRGILMARASAPEGPWTVDPRMITAPEEGWAEGPCAILVDGKTRLYYAPRDDFSAYESADLKDWTNIRGRMNPPGGYRHGTVVRITEADAKRLLKHPYGD